MPGVESYDLAARPFTVDGVDFVSARLGGFRVDDLVVVKPLDVIARYRELFERHTFSRIVELGVAYGGSVALFALLGRPSRMTAIELTPDRVEVLDQFLRTHELHETVTVHYGVNQADRARVREIVVHDVGSEVDLVIDDAHRYEETVATFETLFPLLVPGGRYLIEDWSSDHEIRSLLAAGLEKPDGQLRSSADAIMAEATTERGAAEQTAVAASSLATGRPALKPLSRLAVEFVLQWLSKSAG